MAWTSPKTWSANAVLTAAELNTYVRDNLNETCAATATAAGDLVYADATNSMGSRLAIGTAQYMLVSSGSAPLWRFTGTREVNPVDDSATAHDTWEDWGTQTIRVTTVTTGHSYQIWAVLTGFATVAGAGAGQNYAARTRVAISLNDGSTWDFGNASQDEMLDTAGSRRVSLVSQHRHNGSITTAIQVKAQFMEENTGNTVGDTLFKNATLAGIIVPDP